VVRDGRGRAEPVHAESQLRPAAPHRVFAAWLLRELPDGPRLSSSGGGNAAALRCRFAGERVLRPPMRGGYQLPGRRHVQGALGRLRAGKLCRRQRLPGVHPGRKVPRRSVQGALQARRRLPEVERGATALRRDGSVRSAGLHDRRRMPSGRRRLSTLPRWGMHPGVCGRHRLQRGGGRRDLRTAFVQGVCATGGRVPGRRQLL
jgi:hypothetical protein